MSSFSDSIGFATEGGKLRILEDGYEIASVVVPAPDFGAENNSDSTVYNEEYFSDSHGNSYKITVYSSMYGGINYEVEEEEIIDKKGLKNFKSSIDIIFEESKPWEYFSPEEIETGYVKRLRWSRKLIEKEFYEISIIINVSSLETLMKDLFKNNPKLWFRHISESDFAIKIFQFLKVYNLKDTFLQELMKTSINTRAEKIKILEQVIKDKIRNIDFQKTENQGSFNWLFNMTFGINIDDFLKSEEINGKKLKEHFQEMYELRHKLIHGVDTDVTIKENESNLYFDVTKKVSVFLINEIEKLNQSKIGNTFVLTDECEIQIKG